MAAECTSRDPDPSVNSAIDPELTDEEGPEWDCDRGFPEEADVEDDDE